MKDDIQSIHITSTSIMAVDKSGRVIPELAMTINEPDFPEDHAILAFCEWANTCGYEIDGRRVIGSKVYRIKEVDPEYFELEIYEQNLSDQRDFLFHPR